MKICRLAGGITIFANLVAIIRVEHIAKIIAQVKADVILEIISPQPAVNAPENLVPKEDPYIAHKRFIEQEGITQVGIQLMPVIIRQEPGLVNIVCKMFSKHGIPQVNVMFICLMGYPEEAPAMFEYVSWIATQ